MRASSYNIYVELENNSDYWLIAHGYSGAIDLLKTEYVNLLKKKDNIFLEDEIKLETFELLKSRGYITEKTVEEERKVVGIIAGFLEKKNKEKTTNSFLFAVTEDCNFRCEYCFENPLSVNGQEWSKKTFTKDLVDKAYSAMLAIQPERALHSNQIGLYGGEPLLAKNFEVVKYIVDEGICRNYSFYAITNGYDLEIYINLLGKGKIELLQITLDGLEETHNLRRKHYLNNDSFSKIVENINLALKTDVRISIRVNTDNSNFGEIEKLHDFFKEKKWIENENFSFSPAPTYRNCGTDALPEVNTTRSKFIESIKGLRESHDNLYNNIRDTSAIEKSLNYAISEDNTLAFKPKFCGAHSGMLLFNSDGKIYPCWEVVGNSNHIIAEFKDEVRFTDSYNKWFNRGIGSIKKCGDCRFALICGGGCAGKLVHQNIDIYNSNCDGYPSIFSKMANLYYNKKLTERFEMNT